MRYSFFWWEEKPIMFEVHYQSVKEVKQRRTRIRRVADSFLANAPAGVLLFDNMRGEVHNVNRYKILARKGDFKCWLDGVSKS